MCLQDQFESIDLSDNSIRKLENFPLLKRLEVLFVHNNRVQWIARGLGDVLPKLHTVMLNNNRMASFGDGCRPANAEALVEADTVARIQAMFPRYVSTR